MLTSVVLVCFFFYQVQSQDTCKSPYVEQRLLRTDVEFASPFYVIALPNTPQTVEMDNVCYTYFENGDGGFFHIMSITYKNGTNTYYDFSKGDITNRMGIAEAKSGECLYHDYTLKPICNVTVFILYRCYIRDKCSNKIDIGPISGVDVRVTLAASPQISPECKAETESSLRDTSELAGGDYILLPQKRTPICITKYNNLVSIGSNRALGPRAVSTAAGSESLNRFGELSSMPQATPTQSQNRFSELSSAPQVTQTQSQNNFFQNGVPPPSAFNPYGQNVRPNAPYPASSQGQTYSYGSSQSYSGSFGASQTSPAPGKTTPTVWNYQPGSPSQWNGQSVQPGADVHHHIWQSAMSAAALKSIMAKSPNVHYHIHSWAQPQSCKCP